MIKEVNEYGFKLIVTPKGVGITKDVFDFEGKIGLVRIIYKEKKNNDYNFNYIKVGNDKLTEKILKCYTIFDAYGGCSTVYNYPFNFDFRTGDEFELSTDNEIERIELYMAQKINIARNLSNYTAPIPTPKINKD